MAVTLAQLLLLSCAISLSASLNCTEVTCCPGEMCVEQIQRRNEITASCVAATSCRETQCPSGLQCVALPDGGVSCQASCNDVQCPEFFQCVAEGSSATCVAVQDCSQIQCPQNTTCEVQNTGGKRAAVCVSASCQAVDCFRGTECSDYNSLGSSGSAMEGSASQPSADSYACLPTCEGTNVCPQGLVCEEDDYKITCRPPLSCDELTCPVGQDCEETPCGIQRFRRSMHRRQSSSAPTGSHITSCVTVTSGNGAVGNPAVGNGASSVIAAKYGTFVAVVVALITITHAFLLLH